MLDGATHDSTLMNGWQSTPRGCAHLTFRNVHTSCRTPYLLGFASMERVGWLSILPLPSLWWTQNQLLCSRWFSLLLCQTRGCSCSTYIFRHTYHYIVNANLIRNVRIVLISNSVAFLFVTNSWLSDSLCTPGHAVHCRPMGGLLRHQFDCRLRAPLQTVDHSSGLLDWKSFNGYVMGWVWKEGKMLSYWKLTGSVCFLCLRLQCRVGD